MQLNGTESGQFVAHMFNDGAIKAGAAMLEEDNRGKTDQERLAAEEVQILN